METVSLLMPDGKRYNLPCIDRRIYTSAVECRKLIPELPGLYLYLSDDNVVYYVGVASNLAMRCVGSHYFSSRRYHADKHLRERLKTTSTSGDIWNQRIVFMPFSLKYTRIVNRGSNAIRYRTTGINYLVVTPESQYLESLCLAWFKPVLNGAHHTGWRVKARWIKELPSLIEKFRQVS